MKNYLMTNHDFQLAKKRFAQFNFQEKADERIRDLIELIASIDGFVPVWSCSGHTLEENSARYPDEPEHHVEMNRFYVIFGVAQHGQDHLDKLLDFYYDATSNINHWISLRPEITFTRLMSPFDYPIASTIPLVRLQLHGSKDQNNHSKQAQYVSALRSMFDNYFFNKLNHRIETKDHV